MPLTMQGKAVVLDRDAALELAQIIYDMTGVDGVVIIQGETVLAAVGQGCPKHEPFLAVPGNNLAALRNCDSVQVVGEGTLPACDESECPCPLRSAILIPFQLHNQTAGLVKLYVTTSPVESQQVVRLGEAIRKLLQLQAAVVESSLYRERLAQARLEALQAQIRPHFLFNTLNTILHFTYTDIKKGQQLLVKLADYFRRSLDTEHPYIPLAEEVAYVNDYLFLEQSRFGDRLRVKVYVAPGAMSVRVPALILQPLVENAIQHGIGPREEGGAVYVRIRRRRDHISVLVADNGVGMRTDIRQQLLAGRRNPGIGLANVRERLLLVYGGRARMTIHSLPGRGTVVRLRLPLELPAGPPAAAE